MSHLPRTKIFKDNVKCDNYSIQNETILGTYTRMHVLTYPIITAIVL